MGLVTIGVDLGQRRDPTAIAVMESEYRQEDTRVHHMARHLERLPLGTPYPDVAERIAMVAAGATEHAGRVTLYVDATGVGMPVVDELRRARVPAKLYACYFTHGDQRTVQETDVRIGKAWLVSRLQVLLQGGRLHLPRTVEAEALARELLEYEIKIDTDANDRYGAFRVGTHDDLVTALGLAVQVDPKRPLVVPPELLAGFGVRGW